MKSAAPKAYISRRMIERYAEQRRMQSEAGSFAAKSGPVVSAQNFVED